MKNHDDKASDRIGESEDASILARHDCDWRRLQAQARRGAAPSTMFWRAISQVAATIRRFDARG
jgi:hypothetical protein